MSELNLLDKAVRRRLFAKALTEALADDNREAVALVIYQIMALYELSYREVAEMHADFAVRMANE